MFLTADLLKKYNACEQGIKYISRFYPTGANLIDIIHDRHISKEFLHWGREHLQVTPEELEAYLEVCGIVNTENHWYSQNLHDCNFIVKSKDIDNSQRIFNSNDVSNSSDIVYGDTIINSEQVFTSSMVTDSHKVAHSTNVTASDNVCFSTMILSGENIYNSKNVFSSSEIIRCDTVTDSYFCQDCKNIKHCMFCKDLEGVEYYLFNQEVDKERFELFVQQYKRFMTSFLAFAPCWPSGLVQAYSPAITQKFDEWYKPVSDKFWKWVRTLPGYSAMMLYNITMNPTFLNK